MQILLFLLLSCHFIDKKEHVIFCGPDLLIIDDFGLNPFKGYEAEDIYEIVCEMQNNWQKTFCLFDFIYKGI